MEMSLVGGGNMLQIVREYTIYNACLSKYTVTEGILRKKQCLYN